MNILDIYTRSIVTVTNLITDETMTYTNLDPVTALINTVILESGNASQLHNPQVREQVKGKIILGKLTIAIEDWVTGLREDVITNNRG